MRAQANCVHFFGALVFDVGSEQLFGEHIAFEQERMIFLQSIQCIFERAWHRGNFGQLLRAQVVDILVERLTGIDLFSMPSSPAIIIAADAMYGLQLGSGGRYSTRLALGDAEYIGMRQAAERLRRE